MPAPVYAALVHFPVLDKHSHVVSTSITNLDIHDIGRSARTFGLHKYFLVTPIETQHWLTRKVISHWEEGWGATYNPNRRDALGLVEVVCDLEAVDQYITQIHNQSPEWVVTSARPHCNSMSYTDYRIRLQENPERPVLLIFGTGWGLHPEIMLEADVVLEPIHGPTDYNHLSVRSAAAIIFDRLFAPDRQSDPTP